MILKVNDGVLLVNKPSGISSNKLLSAIKRQLNIKSAGHTGTLDQLAEGLLIVCLGESTKFSSHLIDADKTYIATGQLGIVTNTGDSDGQITDKHDVNVSKESVENVVKSFVGNITQVPPIYSALKYQGHSLYKYAIKGISVPIKSRTIVIYKIELTNFDNQLHQFTIKASVSKGTYIRTLIQDIGEKLGCGATVIKLIRTSIAAFSIEKAFNFLLDGCNDNINDYIKNTDVILQHLDMYNLNDDEFVKIKFGHSIAIKLNICNENSNDKKYRLYYNGLLVGIGKYFDDKLLPIRLLKNLHLFDTSNKPS